MSGLILVPKTVLVLTTEEAWLILAMVLLDFLRLLFLSSQLVSTVSFASPIGSIIMCWNSSDFSSMGNACLMSSDIEGIRGTCSHFLFDPKSGLSAFWSFSNDLSRTIGDSYFFSFSNFLGFVSFNVNFFFSLIAIKCQIRNNQPNRESNR